MPPFFRSGNAMKRIRYALLLVAACIVGCAAAVEAPQSEHLPGPRSVLFVGNSFTYYNNSLHNHYRRLARAAAPNDERPGRVRIMTISGGQLPEHAAGLPAMLASHDWDTVVLQGHSRGPIEDETAAAFREAAADFARQIRERGAEPVLFMTWAYSDRPDMTAVLDAAYTSTGQAIGARVAPVGLAFAKATTERPDIELRIADGRHPSLEGTYLAACVFLASLHGVSPVGSSYTAGLDADVAAYLQNVAWTTVGHYSTRR